MLEFIGKHSEDIIGALILAVVILGFMYLMGRLFESDLKDMEKTHPHYRKYLRDKYDI